MPRIAATTSEQIRSTILSMLTEAREPQPATRERFRRIVSVRKLRERLGAGDPATLGRAINAIEAELIQAGVADIAFPDIPAEIVEQKLRTIPLPIICIGVLRKYRMARGLSLEPKGHEQIPLIHGFKGGSLQQAGLYNEVKVIFDAVAKCIEQSDPENATLLRASSPHWLRHAYAKTLVVDHKVPLPVAQSLLGHASVQTTAAYAKTDLSQLREFVESSFTKE
jgi:site-specific recombinase XerD